MSGSSNLGRLTLPSAYPLGNQSLQQQQLSFHQPQQLSFHQQQHALGKIQAQQHKSLKQNGLSQLGNLTVGDTSPQCLQTLMTNVEIPQKPSNIQHLQKLQNYRIFQSVEVFFRYIYIL